MANNELSLDLSASDVAEFTGWPDAMVSDYISRGVDYMLVGSGDPNTASMPANRTRQYFDSAAGACDQWDMKTKSRQPKLDDGRISVAFDDCCEYIERIGESNVNRS